MIGDLNIASISSMVAVYPASNGLGSRPILQLSLLKIAQDSASPRTNVYNVDFCMPCHWT